MLLAGLALVAAVLAVRWLRPAPVAAAPVLRGTAIEAVYATGTVEAVDRVTVKAWTAGAIVELAVKEGALVKKGDLLARIDSRSLRFDLERASAESWAAARQGVADAPQIAVLEAQSRVIEAELKAARDDQERVHKLRAANAVPPVDLDRIVTKVAVIQAQLVANSAQRRALRIELTARANSSRAAAASVATRVVDAEVRAPIGGVVLSRAIEPGEVVTVNQPLFRIGDVDHLILECTIDEADVAKVVVGTKAAVSLYAFPRREYRAEVIEVMPDADRAKKSFLLKVRLLEPPAGLRSGMSAEVNVIVEERPGALLAPADAVDSAGNVWVVKGGRAQRRAVRTGVRDLVRVEVLGGLAEGELVVTSGWEKLAEGARVKPVPVLQLGAAAAPR